jgi:hypothetical protein
MGRYWSDAGWDQTSGFRTANGSWDDAGWDALAWNDAGLDSGGWDSAD